MSTTKPPQPKKPPDHEDRLRKLEKDFGALAEKVEAFIASNSLGERIMEAIQQFADRVDAAFTALGTSVDGLVTTSDGLVADAALLKKMIAELQASTGTVTAEDQARLDKIETAAGNLVSKVGGLAQKLADLDAATEPEVIPTPTP